MWLNLLMDDCQCGPIARLKKTKTQVMFKNLVYKALSYTLKC